MRVSKNFLLSELIRSSTAKRLDIDNEPTKKHLRNLQRTVDLLLQPLRDAVGPIRVSSGYRSKALNRAIGGSNKSQHCKAEALDLQYWEDGIMNNKVIYDWIIKSDIEFDQMINEFDFSWIHISLAKKKIENKYLKRLKTRKEILNTDTQMIKNLIGKLIGQASEIIDEVVTTDEEREQLKKQFKEVVQNHERDMYAIEVEDRKSARVLFKDDSYIQKILAIIFTSAYFFLSYTMFEYFVMNTIELSDYEIGFISTVFGAMSSKVNTIVDFFFGGSSKK